MTNLLSACSSWEPFLSSVILELLTCLWALGVLLVDALVPSRTKIPPELSEDGVQTLWGQDLRSIPLHQLLVSLSVWRNRRVEEFRMLWKPLSTLWPQTELFKMVEQ